MHVLEIDFAQRRRAPVVAVNHRVDDFIGELREEMRLPVVTGAPWVAGIQRGIELAVGRRAERIQHRIAECLDGPHRSFTVAHRTALGGSNRNVFGFYSIRAYTRPSYRHRDQGPSPSQLQT